MDRSWLARGSPARGPVQRVVLDALARRGSPLDAVSPARSRDAQASRDVNLLGRRGSDVPSKVLLEILLFPSAEYRLEECANKNERQCNDHQRRMNDLHD